MKRILVILFLVSSCSSMWSHRTVSKNEPTPVSRSVPKEQYDELARKYQELLNMKKNSPPVAEAVEVIDVKKEVQVKPATGKSTNIDPSELVNHLDKSLSDAAPTIVGVDALKEEAKKGPVLPNSVGVEQVTHTEDVDEQINQLREATNLIQVNKFDAALAILKDLETSKERQVVVRAKLMLGDSMFKQGQFDLAMQAYEDIIKHHAFSGLIVKALGRLVSCSEKLKQPEKQAKYYSLLHDFFEAV